ncbi:hypothetical protein ENUP19_0146G0015 [Entamoeba nuttalli]|uniref:NADP-dependent alcohol dehydrogenase, putative n=2 Tax=Entamoeba nuttalli TaxID=412467 RepID=K2H3W6_ENTNP|nr:NADP-dependent alcohol dehydrogenase, putative [Entamoeba nuttalli P19]EKE42168.1 NADP-dependent alcohol dehydrogenase, putative [Entamoeba nuttalli P19]|eukprot:XP_008855504.1 NADP-dependent alcohol dehydrogenase, putative [Entamoeba nuttalli P19]
MSEEKTMKCLCVLDNNKIGWIEKPIPECGPLDVICRPLVLTPCTSDCHTVWDGVLGQRKNITLGHEAVGQIVKVGSLVKTFKVGDKVIVPAVTPDWGSSAAQDGFSQHSNGMLSGCKYGNIKDGVFAEYFNVNEADANLALVPQGVSNEDAVMLSDMVTTGFYGVELANIQFGDVVCVFGIGPVGLMAVLGCVLRGASRIFAVGSREHCCEVAKAYGATDIINYKNGDPVAQIMKATLMKGVDKVVIAGGSSEVLSQAIKIAKPGADIGNVNYFTDLTHPIEIPKLPWGLGMANKTIRGGMTPGGRRRMEKLSSLLEFKRIDVSKLITHRFEGFDKLEEALITMHNKPSNLIKPVVTIHYEDEETLH